MTTTDKAYSHRVTYRVKVEPYYDPFDFDIDDDPYPVWKRLRDESPLYRNDKYGFYALTRHTDVARELANWQDYRSGKGTTIDIILNGLRASLNLEEGGNLAQNLYALYDYMARRLLHANLNNDSAALDEVLNLLSEIHGAWVSIGDEVAAESRASSTPAA